MCARPPGELLLAERAQLAPVGERLVLQDADGTHERIALLAMARLQILPLGPPRKLAVRGEPEHHHLVT
jgi:hypothetical protein